jgi:general transcription factor 3C polypeptide 3 (transcription factor C subunit 4)
VATDASTVAVRMSEFYGISREDWLSLVVKVCFYTPDHPLPSLIRQYKEADIQYCCVLMAKHENEVALEILEHMVWSAVFYNRRCEIAMRLTLVGECLSFLCGCHPPFTDLSRPLT